MGRSAVVNLEAVQEGPSTISLINFKKENNSCKNVKKTSEPVPAESLLSWTAESNRGTAGSHSNYRGCVGIADRRSWLGW